MRILQINDYRRAGGCELMVQLTTDLLRASGQCVEIFVGAEAPGGQRTVLGYIDSRAHRNGIAARLRAFKPDVIHLHNFYHELSPGILAPIRTFKQDHPCAVVMTAHDHHLVCPNAGFNTASGGTLEPADTERVHRVPYLLTHRWDERSAGHSALKLAQHLWNYRIHDRRHVIDQILAPSRFVGRMMSAAGLAVTHHPNPAPPPMERVDRDNHQLHMIFAGRLEPEKGLLPFVHHLPDALAWQWTIVGDGTQRAQLEAACKARLPSWKIRFTGTQSHDETRRFIGAAHVLVLPSTCCENQPMVLMEALSAGTNLLVSNRGGIPEVVEDSGVGYTFAPESNNSVRTEIEGVVTAFNAGSLNTFDATPWLNRRHPDVWIKQLLDVYDRLIPS